MPGILLEKELAEDECKLLRKQGKRIIWKWSSPWCRPSSQLSRTSLPGIENGKSRFHRASYALNDIGKEVEEIDYMSNFYKRFNKVMLDKLAIPMERNKLSNENTKLANALWKFIDRQTILDSLKTKYILVVGSTFPFYGRQPISNQRPILGT